MWQEKGMDGSVEGRSSEAEEFMFELRDVTVKKNTQSKTILKILQLTITIR